MDFSLQNITFRNLIFYRRNVVDKLVFCKYEENAGNIFKIFDISQAVENINFGHNTIMWANKYVTYLLCFIPILIVHI